MDNHGPVELLTSIVDISLPIRGLVVLADYNRDLTKIWMFIYLIIIIFH